VRAVKQLSTPDRQGYGKNPFDQAVPRTEQGPATDFKRGEWPSRIE